MLHRFKTFETFEPKKVEERGIERLEKIMSAINTAHDKVQDWKKAKSEIEDLSVTIGDYIEFYYLKIPDLDAQSKIAAIPTLEKILDIMEQLDIRMVTSSAGHSFTQNAVQLDLTNAQKLQQQRTYTFNISNKLKTNSKGTDHVFDIEGGDHSVIFYVEDLNGVGKSFTLLRGTNENTRYFSVEGKCAPNGKDYTVVWFVTVPKKFDKILKVLEKSSVKISKDPKADYYTLS